MRLNRLLAKRSHLSRRKADQAIQEGRVMVNGRLITNPALDVEESAKITLDGKPLSCVEDVYLAFNKPRGVVCTHNNKQAKLTIYDFLPKDLKLASAGRLDKASRGLILLSNDGAFLNRIMHPRFQIQKEYELILKGDIPLKYASQQAIAGVKVGSENLKIDYLKLVSFKKDQLKILVGVCEGKHHHLRRLFSALGYKVLDVKRVKIGKLSLKSLNIAEGEFKRIRKEDVI